MEGIDVQALRLRGRRATVHDLHGPFSESGPLWPDDLASVYCEDGLRAMGDAASGAPVMRWEHGRLVEVVDERTLEALRKAHPAWRLAGAVVGPVSEAAVTEADRAAHAAYMGRGWNRLLTREFKHVGCKLAHTGQRDALAEDIALRDALDAARRRPRTAVLEELLGRSGETVGNLRRRLDEADRALDAAAGGRSWCHSQVPGHVLALWPMRNLLRLADRAGVIFREFNWQAYEEESSYAPEIPVLCLETEIYGAGIEHDVTHFLAPVLWSSDRLEFEVANNGIEGDGQAMNSLILASWHSGPAYEGYAGWPGATLFEWLERAFGVTSIPEQIAALRTFTVALHKGFEGDRVALLNSLAPNLSPGEHLEDLLAFYPEYVQHDHDFLGALHPRYVTPFYRTWKKALSDRTLEDFEACVQRANDLLWLAEDIDLQGWDHPITGESSNLVQVQQTVLSRALELQHLVQLAGDDGADLRGPLGSLVHRLMRQKEVLRRWRDAAHRGVSGPASDLSASERQDVDEWRRDVEDAKNVLGGFVRETRAAQGDWAGGLPKVPEDFLESPLELFRGYYFEAPRHVGTDELPTGRLLPGCARQASGQAPS